MNGVHDVGETNHGTVGYEMNILIPVGTAYQHNVVGVVLADFTNHLCGIFLQVGPRVFYGFVIYLIDDVRIFAVFLCHAAEELLSLLSLGQVRVPVDDDVDVLLDGRLYDGCHALHGKGGVLQVVVFYHDAHGSTDNRAVPVTLEGLYHLLIIEARPQIMPPQAYAAQGDGIAALVAQLCSLDLQLAVLLDGVEGVCIACKHTEQDDEEGFLHGF